MPTYKEAAINYIKNNCITKGFKEKPFIEKTLVVCILLAALTLTIGSPLYLMNVELGFLLVNMSWYIMIPCWIIVIKLYIWRRMGW